MRLTLYYALHSFINQVRKMLKTWVLIFIVVCALIGGVIGAGAVKIGELSEETAAQTEAETGEAAPETPSFSLSETLGIEKSELTELAAGADLAYGASLAAGRYILQMSRLSPDDTYRYVIKRENELTMQAQKEAYDRVIGAAATEECE